MIKVSFATFKKNVSFYFTEVEKGETLRIIKHGKVIAKISPPFSSRKKKVPSWKKEGLRLTIKGKDLSSEILQERENK